MLHNDNDYAINKLFHYFHFSDVFFNCFRQTTALIGIMRQIIAHFTLTASVSRRTYYFFIIILLSQLNYPRLFVHRSLCYASQSSSSVVGCGAGSGGMTSDILANAPPVPAGTSPDSPPAGPLPEMPTEKRHIIYCMRFQ